MTIYAEFLILTTLNTLCSLYTSRLLDTRSLTARYALRLLYKYSSAQNSLLVNTRTRKRIHTLRR